MLLFNTSLIVKPIITGIKSAYICKKKYSLDFETIKRLLFLKKKNRRVKQLKEYDRDGGIFLLVDENKRKNSKSKKLRSNKGDA